MSTELFKRNQVDAALHALLSGPLHTAYRRSGLDAPKPLQKQITNLLEIDREWGRGIGKRLKDFPMAFHDEVPTGSGVDIQLSAFHTFMLAIALDLLRMGFKPREIVEVVSLLRPKLGEIFKRSNETLMTKEETRLIDDKKWKLPQVKSRRGDHMQLDPRIFLVLRRVEVPPRDAMKAPGVLEAHEIITTSELALGWNDLSRFLQQDMPNEVHAAIILELSELAARIVEVLPLQPVRKRGRSQ